MRHLGRGLLLAAVALASSLSVTGPAQGADCGAEVEKAKAEWEQIQKKGEAGAFNHWPQRGGKAIRSLDEVLRKADEANKAGKKKRCANIIKKLRGQMEGEGLAIAPGAPARSFPGSIRFRIGAVRTSDWLNFSTPRLIIPLLRPVRVKQPSESKNPSSPVRPLIHVIFPAPEIGGTFSLH